MNLKDKQKDKRLFNTYGITLKDWTKLFNQQEGVCAICKAMPKNQILCVDHLHAKGYKKMESKEKKKYVRGLLCFTCNTSFGRIERRKTPRRLLEGIIEYFKKYKMKGDE